MTARRRSRATRPLAALAMISVIALGCQANPVGSVSAPSPVIASQPIPTQAPASPSSAAVATPAATRTPAPTPNYPTRLRRPTGLTVDGTCEDSFRCLGLLDTAKHHSALFSPGFSFSMPVTGWENTLEEGGVMPFIPIAEPGDGITFFRGAKANKSDGTVDASVTSDVDALSAWLTANPDLSASAPVPVSVGGLSGVRIDLTVAPNATSHTTDCKVVTCVWFLSGRDPSTKPTWLWDFGIVSSERLRVYLLKAKDGVVTIIADSLDGTTWDDLTATTEEFLKTVTFDK